MLEIKQHKTKKQVTIPIPFRDSSIVHWGFVVGMMSQPNEC